MQVLEFKKISPFFEMCRDGQKPFDIRLVDHRDKRFKALWVWGEGRYQYHDWDWGIKFTNPANGENFTRKLISWEYIKHPIPEYQKPAWIIIYLGEV